MTEWNLEGDITEQRLIEMGDHFKEILNRKDDEIKSIKREGHNIRKLCYTLISGIEMLHDSMLYLHIDDDSDDTVFFQKLLENLVERGNRFMNG